MYSSSTPAASRTARTQQDLAIYGLQNSLSVGQHSSNCSLTLLQTTAGSSPYAEADNSAAHNQLRRPCVPRTAVIFELAQTPYMSSAALQLLHRV